VAKLLEALESARGTGPIAELEGTPERVRDLWLDNLVSGYGTTPSEALGAPLHDDGGALVTLSGIPFHGVCPHHLLPFHGIVHLAYAPRGRIVGLGRLERLVACLSRRLVLQETLTHQLAVALMTTLDAAGAACAVEAEHLCLVLQGREPRGARLHTRVQLGTLEHRPDVLPPVARGGVSP
jgi:GTP cyclohydrolase I